MNSITFSIVNTRASHGVLVYRLMADDREVAEFAQCDYKARAIELTVKALNAQEIPSKTPMGQLGNSVEKALIAVYKGHPDARNVIIQKRIG